MAKQAWGGGMIPATAKGKLTPVQEAASELHLVCVFTSSLDERFKPAIDALVNDYNQHGKEWLKDIPAMVTWLNKFRGKTKDNRKKIMNNLQEGSNRIKYPLFLL
ncbi:hypothetical protein SEMRO_166_G074280.1 [Seminavis robusta]|uniref:Uncharacterized protein n=1 Tax=Seminavis robusta TaxID=568900 RepID=A0A9N8DJS6_9STRA|nr:hypothetical protein SEMRO_166_G074280.1 [Seminavis robusta]|eukprot:Sro166_g074280.1 n/a (105) ;mRNA; f:94378-94692